MAFERTTLYGNVMNIKTVGKKKVISFSPANFGKSGNEEAAWQVSAFESSYPEVAKLEAKLAEVREATGRENAAAQHVRLDVFMSIQEDGSYQPHLSKILAFGKDDAAKAEVKAEAQEAPVATEA